MDVTQQAIQVIIPNRSKHSLHSSKRIDRERASVQMKINKNRENYFLMKDMLNKAFQGKACNKHLLPLAKLISKVLKIPLERIAQRYYDALVCWFVENWKIISSKTPQITEILEKMYQNKQMPDDFDFTESIAHSEDQDDPLKIFSDLDQNLFRDDFSFPEFAVE